MWAADALRSVLLPFIVTTGGLLVLLLLVLVIERSAREIAWRAHDRRRRRCEPLVTAWLSSGGDTVARDRLVAACGGRSRRAAAELLLAPLQAVRGDLVERSRDGLTRLGLVEAWRVDLRNRRWWRRAQAVRALGLIGERPAVAAIAALLADAHEEVRAAAVEALGRIADVSTLPAVAAALFDPRHQRVRVVGALRGYGSAAAGAVARACAAFPGDRPAVADILGQLGGADAVNTLTAWAADGDPTLRAAAWRAIGDIGPDERAFYFALRGLGDEEAGVRAMAARAVGRSGRADAAPYLAARLSDVWTVAAESAAALKRLGEAGRQQLAAAAAAGAAGAELAEQMMWELQP